MQQLLRVARCIVADNLLGITCVDIVNVLAQGAARFRFDFLNFFQSTAGDKESSRCGIIWKDLYMYGMFLTFQKLTVSYLAVLSDDILEDVGRCIVQQGLQRR